MKPARTVVGTKLSQREKISYGFGSIAVSLIWTITTTFSMYFFTDIFGIPAAAAGTMLLVARFYDGAIDPFIGNLVDRTKTRWGKARPYILFFAIPYGVIGAFMFYTPNLSVQGKIIYAYIFYFLLVTVYSFIAIPYATLGSLLSKDEKVRSAVGRNSTAMGMIGYVLIALLPMIAGFLGKGETAEAIQRSGFFRTALIFGLLSIVFWLLCFFNTKEYISEANAAIEKVHSLWTQFKALVKNRPWVVYMSAMVFSQIRVSVLTIVLPYYWIVVMGQPEALSTIPLLATLGAMTVGLFVGHWVIDFWGVRGSYMIAYAGGAVGNIIVLLSGSNVVLMFVGMIIVGICIGVTTVVSAPVDCHVIEYGEWKTGIRTSGLHFASFSFIQQAAVGVGSFVIGNVLTQFGYDPAALVQNAQTIAGIRTVYTWVPIFCSALIIVIMMFYPITTEKYNQIIQELDERNGTNLGGGGQTDSVASTATEEA